jgi:predicted lipase
MLALPTDAELVDLCAATYAPAAVPYIADINQAMRVFLTTRADGLNIIAVEGTHNRLGWMLDLFSVTVADQQGLSNVSLGFIHAGFYAAAVSALTRIALVASRGPYAICGHSLGAIEAILIGAMLIQDGLPPVKIGAFAPPRGGGDGLVKVATSVPLCAYRFGNDPVPDVPFTIPGFPFRQVPLTAVGAPMVDAFQCHNIANYVAAVHAVVPGHAAGAAES